MSDFPRHNSQGNSRQNRSLGNHARRSSAKSNGSSRYAQSAQSINSRASEPQHFQTRTSSKNRTRHIETNNRARHTDTSSRAKRTDAVNRARHTDANFVDFSKRDYKKNKYSAPNRSSNKSNKKSSAASNPLAQMTYTIQNATSMRSEKSLLAKALLVVFIIFVVFIVVNLYRVFTYPNIYAGVHIGDVDVSGMTQQEATEAISDYYSPRIANTKVRVFAGDAGRENFYNGEGNNEEIAEQLSTQEANANVNYWDVDSTSFETQISSDDLVARAYEVGREDGGFLRRLGAQFFGNTIQMQLNYEDGLFEKFASTINKTLGYEKCDWNIEVRDGHASTTEGYDGQEVNTDTLKNELTQAFISPEASHEIVANVNTAEVNITQSEAQSVADMVNSAISNGVLVSYAGSNHAYTASQVGSWVQTTKSNTEGQWQLIPSITPKKFSADFYADFQATSSITDTQLSFDVQGENVIVNTNGEGQVPHLTDAISALNSSMFEHSTGATNEENNENSSTATQPSVIVESGSVPKTLTYDEALEMQVLTEVSTYTTTFSDSAGTEARNTNIRIGASELNKTVCKANGGTWSFNGIVGDTTQEKGYLAAGSIAEGEYVDTYGGGICQVATTVFNALYESPYKITERHPHSLYISSYPAGRDAAIAWSDLDLSWANETTSDVLMVTSSDETSVTVSLYSTPQTFSVESKLGDWQEGSTYRTVVKEDETLAKGYSYVKTTGTNGSKISVTRTVYDANKQILYTNEYVSEYEPKNKVIVCGPGTEVDTSTS